MAQKRNLPRETMRRRFGRSLDAVIRTARWRSIPLDADLIAIADAFIERIKGVEYTVYLILLKPVDASRAVICPPVYLRGHEDARGWTLAFRRIPRYTRERVRALICDGHSALRGVAIEHHWLMQRCHFHLKLGLCNYLSTSQYARQKVLACLVHQSVNILLRAQVRHRYWRALTHLEELLVLCHSSKLRLVIKGFLRHIREYRTYLRHPSLHLPTTTNACESLVRCVRETLHRTRGFRTHRSFVRWTNITLKQRGTIICRGFDQPN